MQFTDDSWPPETTSATPADHTQTRKSRAAAVAHTHLPLFQLMIYIHTPLTVQMAPNWWRNGPVKDNNQQHSHILCVVNCTQQCIEVYFFGCSVWFSPHNILYTKQHPMIALHCFDT